MSSKKEFVIDCLTKVEGHAKLDVSMDGGKVGKAELSVFEPSRYFESMVVGKRFDEVPSISQRICGICSVIHTVTAVKAVENAIGVKPSAQSVDLRKLLLYSSIIHSHTAHLFFFAAPDYLGLNDVTEMARKKREQMKLCIEAQTIASGIVRMIGGRPLHPVTPRIGYFTSVPDADNIDAMSESFRKLKELSLKTVKLFGSFRYPKFENETQYVALSGKGVPLYDGDLHTTGGKAFRADDYGKHVEEEVLSRSTAKYARYNGSPYMVGALSRLNVNQGGLSASAKSAAGKAGMKLPAFSPFMNNLAQAVEMVHFSDEALGILKRYERGMKEESVKVRPKAGEGVAACEAPRGTLYHHYRFDASGRVKYANIITPTCQNVRNMEFDMQAIMPMLIKQPDAKVKRTLEMLIRAYDPCFSCSTHFLDLRLRR